MLKLLRKKNKKEEKVSNLYAVRPASFKRSNERYKEFRKQRKLTKLKSSKVDLNKKVVKKINFKKVATFFLVIGLLVGLGFGAHFLITSEKFTVREVKIESNAKVEQAFIDKYKGENLFKLRISKVKDFYLSALPNAKAVYVRKILPDKLAISVDQNIPLLIKLDYNGFSLVNDQFDIVSTTDKSRLVLNDNEKSIYLGQGDFNAEYIREIYLSRIDQDKRALVDWKKVPDANKKQILSDLKVQIINRVNAYFDALSVEAAKTYSGLPLFVFYSYASDLTSEEVQIRLKMAYNFRQFIIRYGYKVKKIEWITDFSLKFTTKGNQEFLFSLKREINDQKKDFAAAKARKIMSNNRIVDFRSDYFSGSN